MKKSLIIILIPTVILIFVAFIAGGHQQIANGD